MCNVYSVECSALSLCARPDARVHRIQTLTLFVVRVVRVDYGYDQDNGRQFFFFRFHFFSFHIVFDVVQILTKRGKKQRRSGLAFAAVCAEFYKRYRVRDLVGGGARAAKW